jgi:hypothetical protein
MHVGDHFDQTVGADSRIGLFKLAVTRRFAMQSTEPAALKNIRMRLPTGRARSWDMPPKSYAAYGSYV